MASEPTHKFTLSGLLHRTRKLTLKADVVINDVVKENYPVGWVRVQGSKDPEYLVKSSKYVTEYQDLIEEKGKDLTTGEMIDALQRVNSASVACSIVEWDTNFFEGEFTIENAMKVFGQRKFILIYNQIAMYIQEAVDFLPHASQQQHSG